MQKKIIFFDFIFRYNGAVVSAGGCMKNKNSTGTVDLIHGPIFRSLIVFMIPIMISSAFQQLYNAVDTAIVGNVLGEKSLAAIGSCSSVFEMFVGFSFSLGAGFAITTSRAYGSHDEEKIRKTCAASLVIGLGVSLLITVLSFFLLKPLLHLIHTPDAVFAESYTYISIIASWIIVMFAYNLCSDMLRAIGNSFIPLLFLIFSSLLNIGLDLYFIKSLHMGVAGAAAATVAAQGVSVILCIIYILTKARIIVPHKEDFRFDREIWSDVAGQGFAMALMGSIVSVGSIILQSGINSLGEEIIAGHVAARKIYAICNLPFMAMAMAMSTFIPQNRGAGESDRILRGMKDAVIYEFLAAAVMTVFLAFCARPMVHWISGSDNPVILNNGSKMLYVVAPFYSVLGVLCILRNALQGIGYKLIPMVSSVIEFFGKILFTVIFIPRYGYDAVVWCEPLIWCAMTVQLLYAWFTNPYVKEIRGKK